MTLDQALASTLDGVHSQDGTACVVGLSHEGWRVAFRFDTTSWEVDRVAFQPPEPTAAFKPLRQLPIAKLSAEARRLAIADRAFPTVSVTKLHLSRFLEDLEDGRGKPTLAADYVGLAVEYVLWRQRGGVSPARRFSEEVGGTLGTWHKRIERARTLGLWTEVHGRCVLTDLGRELAGGKYDHPNPDMVGRPVPVSSDPRRGR